MQKARHLMDENSVSFQMFVILLYSITLGSESQFTVFRQCLSNTWQSGLLFFFSLFPTGGAWAEAKIWRWLFFQWKKKLHKALCLVQFLASFISFYFEIVSYLACGEKIIRLASKNSVKLNEKSASDF